MTVKSPPFKRFIYVTDTFQIRPQWATEQGILLQIKKNSWSALEWWKVISLVDVWIRPIDSRNRSIFAKSFPFLYLRPTMGERKERKNESVQINSPLGMQKFVFFSLWNDRPFSLYQHCTCATIVHRIRTKTSSKREKKKIKIDDLQLWYAMKMSIGWHWKVYRRQSLCLPIHVCILYCIQSRTWDGKAMPISHQLIHITQAHVLVIPMQWLIRKCAIWW